MKNSQKYEIFLSLGLLVFALLLMRFVLSHYGIDLGSFFPAFFRGGL